MNNSEYFSTVNRRSLVGTKAFVPSRDFDVSKAFYKDIGFEMGWASEDMAYFNTGNGGFLLQKFYIKEHADNFVMSLLVENVDDWWERINSNGVANKYSVEIGLPEDREWGLRDFTIIDPAGVLWRIATELNKT